MPTQYSGLRAAVQGHYGEQDQMYPVAQARELESQIREESGADVEFFYYPAGHAFHNEGDLLGTYDPDSAKLAWQRTVRFLKERLS